MELDVAFNLDLVAESGFGGKKVPYPGYAVIIVSSGQEVKKFHEVLQPLVSLSLMLRCRSRGSVVDPGASLGGLARQYEDPQPLSQSIRAIGKFGWTSSCMAALDQQFPPN